MVVDSGDTEICKLVMGALKIEISGKGKAVLGDKRSGGWYRVPSGLPLTRNAKVLSAS